MQWVPAHVGIDENEIEDALTKETRKRNNDNINFQETEKAKGLVIFVGRAKRTQHTEQNPQLK